MPATWTALVLLALAADPRAELEYARARKSSEEAAARALHEREGSVLSALDETERSWTRAEAAARVADEQRAAALQRLTEARAAESDARARLAAVQGALGPRLRARARMGDLSRLRILAASGSLAQAVKTRYLWARVTASDLRLLRSAQRALERQQEARAAIEREADEVDRLAAEAGRRRAEAAGSRAEYEALLGAIRSERVLHERAAREAAAQESKLAEFVAALPPSHGAPLHTDFELLRGRLPLPASGTISVGFGPIVNPRFNTVTVQKGLDVRAPAGAPVRSVAPGRVAHAGWFKGYGNLVIVDHGDGFHTLVAHLASISTAAGEEVAAGSPLGTVGDSGSTKGPYVYFEIRENGRPVDPRTWLRP